MSSSFCGGKRINEIRIPRVQLLLRQIDQPEKDVHKTMYACDSNDEIQKKARVLLQSMQSKNKQRRI